MHDPGTVAANVSGLGDAISTLMLFVGPSGLVAVICAYFGYRRGRADTPESTVGKTTMSLATLYADRSAMEELVRAISRLAGCYEDHARAIEDQTRALREQNEYLRRR